MQFFFDKGENVNQVITFGFVDYVLAILMLKMHHVLDSSCWKYR